ncbi:Transposase InsH N-terminal domain-containing protein [Streptococcus pluranimalium]
MIKYSCQENIRKAISCIFTITQTTLPLELSSYLPQDHMVFTIEKVVDELEEDCFDDFYHTFGRPSYHPKMLLSALLFAYTQGVFFGRKIEKLMVENLAMQYLTGQLVVSYRTINRFRVAKGMEDLIRDLFIELTLRLKMEASSLWSVCLLMVLRLKPTLISIVSCGKRLRISFPPNFKKVFVTPFKKTLAP